ncbi:hypothetical protein [Sandarakinorhabdus sp.]|uniref:hypothetical protein n=1 Tax=Sandarakinorhabdus sp. TaxID=1916663 RepID=UPI0035640C44
MGLLAALAVAAAGSAGLMPPGWSVLCPPKRRPDEIVVCADREPARSPYRAPLQVLRGFGERGTASVSAERNRLLGPDAGSLGSCSAMGAGGWTGCKYKEFIDNVNQAAGVKDPRGRAYRQAK